MADSSCPYVSRGGIKLAAALDAFELDVRGYVCADLGCSVGGFTDALLQRGAERVYAVDTAYGQLAWTVRTDPRVVVMERSNALHVELPAGEPGCDLVVVDLGWTKQDKAVPAALRWLRSDGPGWIVTLIKPHYEASAAQEAASRKPRGRQRGGGGHVLGEDEAQAVARQVLDELPALGVEVAGHLRSPITGGKGGNVEYLALLRRQR